MRLNGWIRMLVVLSCAWLAAVGLFAFIEFPDGGRFGGIPVGAFTFWSVVENPFNDLTTSGTSLGLYDVHPNIKAFLLFGAVPAVIPWFIYFAVRWVGRGFERADA